MSQLSTAEIGYRFIDGDMFEFYFPAIKCPDLKPEDKILVSGSFNGWLNTGDSAWQLTKKVEKKDVYYSLQKPFSHVNIPGNTGFPEFLFFKITPKKMEVFRDKEEIKGHTFYGNKLILRDENCIQEAEKICSLPNITKKLSDFDLECPACRAELANIRKVPGTECLYRGYHPYKRSRNELDTEDMRLELVNKAFKLLNINCDITLSGCEIAREADNEKMPHFIPLMEEEDNRLCINIDYNLVNYHSDAIEYSLVLQKISRFIISHSGPYYIHCRLGTDRTGVTSAIFAAICGASWKDIAEDYEKTVNAGIGEYRNRKLLQYSIKNMIGYDPSVSKDLCKQMQSYFIKEQILNADEIEELIKNLIWRFQSRMTLILIFLVDIFVQNVLMYKVIYF